VAASGASERIVMTRSMSNDELCGSLPLHDIFAVHSDYSGPPKAVIEPLLAGLPVVVNRRAGAPVPEFSGDYCVLVENTVEGYLDALRRLVADAPFRERIGRAAYRHAQAHWAPRATESRFAEIYRRFMLKESA
jgi:glycosyltransferase involved in cell wall biosynthesis